MRPHGQTLTGQGGTLRMMRGGAADAASLRLQHALLLIIVAIACLCLVSMAAAQTPSQMTPPPAPARTATAPATPARVAAGHNVLGDDASIDEDARVRAAVVGAIQQRMGREVGVTLAHPRVRLTGILPARVTAVPDIGAHAGGFARFLLIDGDEARGRRVGAVDVDVRVEVEQLRAVQAIPRGAEIGAADVETVTADAGRVPLKPLPPAGRALGAKAAREIAAGRIITDTLLVVSPLVQSGDEVQTTVRMGGIEARGTAVAAQSGALGDEILVVNADSRRRLKGRVIGKREVEVLH